MGDICQTNINHMVDLEIMSNVFIGTMQPLDLVTKRMHLVLINLESQLPAPLWELDQNKPVTTGQWIVTSEEIQNGHGTTIPTLLQATLESNTVVPMLEQHILDVTITTIRILSQRPVKNKTCRYKETNILLYCLISLYLFNYFLKDN